MKSLSAFRRSRLGATLLAGAATAVSLTLLSVVAPAQADGTLPAPDGLSAATAAASCWEVKTNTPSAPSGVYWLYTPALSAPQQFYCDQTTDGGGWVLIGRGRETWSQSGEGFGSPADLRTTVTGTSAFAARQLSAATIGDLLNNAPVTSLPDGIRLRRATNSAGTTWQEVRFTLASPRDDWSWQFDDLQRIKSFSFDGSTGTGGTTESFGLDTAYNHVQTTTVNKNGRTDGWTTGFGYGSSVTGSTSSSDYLYQGSTGYVRPFTQMYLRPKLLSSSFAAFPTAGTPAVTQPSVAKSFALPTVWGVNGLVGNLTGPLNTEVAAFTESSGRVFVGGNFDHVQQNSSGAGYTKQSYLAAFDVHTGQFDPTFRPTFNGQVKALATLPDGHVVAGGEFSTVNGVAENGLVALDAATGAIDTAFTGRLVNEASTGGGQARVNALDVQNGWLYVGGAFTHATGGSITSLVYSRDAVRLAVTDGTPDKTWTTEFDGTVVSLDASAKGDRAYFAGYFAHDKTLNALRVAALTTTTADVIPWTVQFTDTTYTYQQAVKEIGDRVWIGGSQHDVMSFNRSDLSQASRNLMSPEGGDGQALATDGTNVYAGCHCFYGVYENDPSTVYSTPGTSWTRVSKIEAAGAWNATTGAYEPQFSPSFTEREGAGAWAIFTDSTGVTWMGGDFTAVATGNTGKVWAGGYARFAPNDSTAPTAPSGLTVTAGSSGDTLGWTGSTDAGGTVTYQVMRADRVVATTTAKSITLPSAPSGTNYFVRAADPSGNLSASTPAATASPATAPGGTTGGAVLISAGSTWSYYHGCTAPASNWNTTAFDSSAWQTGTAVLGWGNGDITTRIAAPCSPNPLATYFRHGFSIPAGGIPSGGLTLTTRADDGIIVFVNGTEVGRSNLPSGPITFTSYALSAPSTATAEAKPVTFTVPASALVEGSNVISAQVQSNYHATPTVSFDLTAKAG